MYKKIFVLVVSILPLTTYSDVTLYGQIKGGLEYTKVKGVDNTITDVNDWGSRIGFKGEEDLGNGLKAIWQIEQTVSLDNKSSRNERWATRDSFIGLSGTFGTLRAGYLSDTFNSDMEGPIDQWDGNGITVLGSFDRYDTRYTGVRYDSPNWGGFTFNVLYSPEDNQRYDEARKNILTSEIVAQSLDENYGGFQGLVPIINDVTRYKDILAVGLGYENSGWFVQYGYKNVRNAVAEKLNGEVHGVNIGYDNGNLITGLGYRTSRNYLEPLDISEQGKQWESNEGAFTIAYRYGNVLPRLSLAYGEDKQRNTENAKKVEYKQVITGGEYSLSKRTDILGTVAWAQIKPKYDGGDKLESYSAGLGLRHQF